MRTTHVNIFFVIAMVCCLLAVNTGLVQLIHLHQCCEPADDHKHNSSNKHDESKCSICLHNAIYKAIAQYFTAGSFYVYDHCQEQVVPESIELSHGHLLCLLARAPPFAG